MSQVRKKCCGLRPNPDVRTSADAHYGCAHHHRGSLLHKLFLSSLYKGFRTYDSEGRSQCWCEKRYLHTYMPNRSKDKQDFD